MHIWPTEILHKTKFYKLWLKPLRENTILYISVQWDGGEEDKVKYIIVHILKNKGHIYRLSHIYTFFIIQFYNNAPHNGQRLIIDTRTNKDTVGLWTQIIFGYLIFLSLIHSYQSTA